MGIPNILFCYFAHSYQHYIPLDVGYSIALVRKGTTKANCYAARLGADTDENLLKKIRKYNPDAVFFFTDHLTWAGANYYHDALRLAKKLDGIFIGLVSNKLQDVDSRINIFLPAENEYAFRRLDKLLNGKLPVENKPSNLDDLPSPYLAGIFDSALAYHAKFEGFSPFIYSSKGCTNKCHYCFRSVREDKIRLFSPGRFYDEVEYLAGKFHVRNFHLLDDCFVISKGRVRAFVDEFQKRKSSLLNEISCKAMCRLDKLDAQTIQMLNRVRINIVQLGLQTTNPALSNYMGRNMSQEQISSTIDELNRNGFTVQIDLMLGLPHDTFEYFKKSMDFAISKNPQRIQVRQLYLSEGTLFHQMREEYKFRTKKVQDGLNLVTSAAGFDFKDKAYSLLKKSVEEHPEIKWMWTTDEGPSSRLLPKEMLL